MNVINSSRGLKCTTLVLPGAPAYCRLPKGLFILPSPFIPPSLHTRSLTHTNTCPLSVLSLMNTSMMESELESTEVALTAGDVGMQPTGTPLMKL